MDNIINTFNAILAEYESGTPLENEDTIMSWIARCDWFIKQMTDIKVGVGMEYLRIHKSYAPLQEKKEWGEGENDE